MARPALLALALVASAPSGCRASKQDFSDRAEPPIVALLCDHDRPANQLPIYYRKCFDVDEAQCTALMRREVRACASQLVPEVVDEGHAGAVAVRVGACAGTGYELELDRQGKRIHSHACDIARDAYAKARAAAEQP